MLVLTRRPGEQIVIGNGIRVTVVSVGPGRVKIGIEAPADVSVNRQEIHNKILQEQAEQAADVLATVGRTEQTDEPCPTIVSAGDTSPKLHNRIADKMPGPVPPVQPLAMTPPPGQGLLKHRLPRKPR